MNSLYIDYSTNTSINNDYTRYLILTEEELFKVYDYYVKK